MPTTSPTANSALSTVLFAMLVETGLLLTNAWLSSGAQWSVGGHDLIWLGALASSYFIGHRTASGQS